MLFVVSSALAAESWTAATPYPTNIARYAFAQNGEDFYIISGTNSTGNLNSVRRYNATTNAWTSLANIPVASEAPAAVFFAGKIYVADGLGGADNAFRIYDVASNTWTLGPPRPGLVHSRGAAAGAFNGNVYVMGGGVDAPGSSILSIYNVASNTWSAGPDSPFLYRFGGYAQIGQFLYLIGSFQGNPENNSTVSMRLDMATNTWSTGPVWTPRRADFALAAAGSKLFAMGGDLNGGDYFEPSALVNELETSTWPSGAWVASPDNLPSPRQGNQAGFFSTGRTGGEIWSSGGFTTGAGTTYLTEHLFRNVPVLCPNYTITESTRARVFAPLTDIGNHCDDCVTPITLPFPVNFYGTSYTSANVSSNGNLQFESANSEFTNTDLPTAAGFGPTIFPFWDNLRTIAGGGNGIYTSVTGSAPNRVFTVEWAVFRSENMETGTSRFQILFFEGSPDFEIVYARMSGSFAGTIGVQRDATLFTQFAGPNATVPAEDTRLLFTTGCCAPVAFHGALGSNSATYPGSSGVQTGRLNRFNPASACATPKANPGTFDTTPRAYDEYGFTNNSPSARCLTFSFNMACTDTQQIEQILPAAYLGSFDPDDIEANYLGDSGSSANSFNSFSVNVPANSTVVLVVPEVNAGAGCASYDVVVTGLCPLELTSAVSRKTHGAAGDFDVLLPLTGPPGVECRAGQPASGNHKLVFTFNSEVTSGNAAVTAGTGTAGSPTFLGTTMTVPLSGVSDLQKITLTLGGVTNSGGQVLPTTAVGMNVLLGDTTGSKAVNSSDISQTKSQSGQAVDTSNFRADVTVSGSINSSDISLVKSKSGTALP